jgi:hypothetical protein
MYEGFFVWLFSKIRVFFPKPFSKIIQFSILMALKQKRRPIKVFVG